MMRPLAASNPRRQALPFPRRSSLTTLAPALRATSAERSVEPLSTTMTSPVTPVSRSQRHAFWTQTPTLSSSFRHGSTTETSHFVVFVGVRSRAGVRPADVLRDVTGFASIALLTATVPPRYGRLPALPLTTQKGRH